MIDRAADRAKIRNIDPALVRQLYTILVDYSCNLEEEIRKEKAA